MRSILYILLAIGISLFVALRKNYTHIAYPSDGDASAMPVEPVITSDTVRLIFGGDLMQHMPQVTAALTADGSYDYTESFAYVSPMFRDADMAILNLETTITTTNNYSGYPCFASPTAVADELSDMGIDIVLLANNHCCDRGARGIDTTIEELDKRGIRHIGAYRDSIDRKQNNIFLFELDSIRFALVNYTYGTNGIPTPKGRYVNLIDTVAIKRDLSEIDHDSVDVIIACMHWGNEYERKPNREQIGLRNMLQREGVDIIIGGHPHVVQPFEADSTHITFYSLGNLVSNQQRQYCDGGLIAEVEIIRCDTIEGLVMRTVAHPVWVLCPGYRILPRHIGDTLVMSNDARKRYDTFMSDTETLLYD